MPEASPRLDLQQQLDPECVDRRFNDTVDALEDALEVLSSAINPVSAGDSGAVSRGRQNTASGRRRRVTKKIVLVIGIGTFIAAIRLTLRMSEGYQAIILTMVGLAFLVIVDGLDYRDKKRVLEKKHHMESVWEHLWFSTVLALVAAVVIGGYSWLVIYTLR